MEDFYISLPNDVSYIIGELKNSGYEAYAVGGCVRDSMLGRIPDDWDITTSASPEDVKNIFKRTVDTGIEHGTVTVIIGYEGYEVTTYRIDGKYSDGRHPEEVCFTKSLEEDLKRRDFTINAMAYNDEDGLVDLFGGCDDLKRKIVRCVGDPNQRFSEDYLRILRAIRFSAQLGFDIDASTLSAASKLAAGLRKISAERIRVELDKLICSNNPERLITAYEAGITAVVLPEFDEIMKLMPNNPSHIYTVGVHSCKAMAAIPSEPHYLRWTMLLHDIAKPSVASIGSDGKNHFYGHGDASAALAMTIMRRLKFDNNSIRMVVQLIKFHDKKTFDLSDDELRKFASKIGPSFMEPLFLVHRADNTAKRPEGLEIVLAKIEAVELQYRAIRDRGDCLELKDLAVNGSDLIAAGLTPGKEVGEALKKLLDHVLEVPSDNRKDVLLSLI